MFSAFKGQDKSAQKPAAPGGSSSSSSSSSAAAANGAQQQSAARTENEKILAINASSEAPLERQKMIILFMKIRLISLQSRAICK